MSKHRIKSVAVEDDFDDGYDDDYDESGYAVGEEDGLTAEDTEKLRVGTVQVRSALGQGFASISDKEIQDTLWHYYYDIAKSVTYLKSLSSIPVRAHKPDCFRQVCTKPKQAGQDKARESRSTTTG
jgi:elongation factor 1 alpha-like protein